MAVASGGAIFGTSNVPSLRDLYAQDVQQRRVDDRNDARAAEAQKKEQAKNTYFLNKTLDPSKYGTGNPQGPEITNFLLQKREEYANMQKETGMSTAELMGMIQSDISGVQQYLEKSKVFDTVIKKYQTEMEKQGFKATDIDKGVRERIFFNKDEKGGLSPKKFEEIDWDIEGAVTDLLTNGVDNVNINQGVAVKDILNRPLSQLSGEAYRSNTPNAGMIKKTREKGTAFYDPMFDRVEQDKDGVVTGIFKKSMPFLNNDGSVYKSKETDKPVDEVITDDAFDYVYNGNDARKALINKNVNKRVKALKDKGVEVDERDIEYFRRDEATELLYNNSKTRFSSANGLTTSWRRAERPRAATKKEDAVDFSIAPKTEDGGYSIMGQTGIINLGNNPETNRPIKTDDIVMYEDGSVKITYTDRDKFGNAIGQPKVQNVSAEKADKIFLSMRNLPGNKKASSRLVDAVKTAPKPKQQTSEVKKEDKPAEKPKQFKFKGTKNRMY